jgi:hypothetical protein
MTLATPLVAALVVVLTTCTGAICYPLVAGADDPLSMQVTSTRQLNFDDLNGIPFDELSGLAWDQDEEILYAVSDSGNLYHLGLTLSADEISAVTLLKAYRLTDHHGDPLKGDYRDAEGLDVLNAENGISGDTELLVAYERHPRVVVHHADGQYKYAIELVASLADRTRYQRPNKALETVVNHPLHGILVGAEKPLKGLPAGEHVVFKADQGSLWKIDVAQYENSSLTGIEVMENGDLLVLERAFAGLLKPIYISLRRVITSQCRADGRCDSEELLVLSSQQDANVDNFEGLAKIDQKRYLIVSDDNESPIQRTL